MVRRIGKTSGRLRGSISVRARLTLWNVSVLASVLLLLAFTLRYLEAAQATGAIDRGLMYRATHLASWGMEMLGEGEPENVETARAKRMNQTFAEYLLGVFDTSGRPAFAKTRPIPWDTSMLTYAAHGHDGYSTVSYNDEHYRVYSRPIRQRGNVIGVIQLAEPMDEIEREMNRLTNTLFLLVPVAVLVAGFGGAFLTDRSLTPVRNIADAAERIGATTLSERLPVKGRDEFASLSKTLNSLLDRLETAFLKQDEAIEQQRRFTADASHELRTPLTVIQAHTSLALARKRTPSEYKHALQAADVAAVQMNRIVQDLLLLARSDAGQLVIHRRTVSVTSVLDTVANAFAGLQTCSIEIQHRGAYPVVLGDEAHLIRLFTNLVENAVQWTPKSGRITLTVKTEDNTVIVMVEDTGAGIPVEHLPLICERFYRVDGARTRTGGGSGLGLAICRSIVEAHHGSMIIESEVGVGTTVTVRL